LVDHVSDEFDAGCAANLVVAFEAAFEVENETFEQQLADIGKLERTRSSIKILNETFEQRLANIGKLERTRSSSKIFTINQPIKNLSIDQ
jgi:hypothetical protein